MSAILSHQDGITGKCQTIYHVKERYNKDNVKVFNVTKVRDLTNCTESPYFMFKTNDLKTTECTEQECTKELVRLKDFQQYFNLILYYVT